MPVTSSPPVLGALAHDLRWTIVGMLVAGDLRTSEIVQRTGQAPSLVSYHLTRLRDAGLISAQRSAADGRDSYHSLDLDALGRAVAGAAEQIHPGLIASTGTAAAPARSRQPAGRQAGPPGPGDGPLRQVQVLFICSGNSARSPMAEGWLNHLGGGMVTAHSAGVTPAPLHPLAVAAMAEHGVDIAGHRATPLSAYADSTFARVITLCDRAREECGELPESAAAVHWSIPNPSQAHPPDLDAFRATARLLHARIRYLLPLLGLNR
jgi:ArsR family transcriptional regulator, arsenate/arsenite/antimonite-responsive transcriptional repressor / arsenate reductase (thioredoxin)